MRDRRDLVETRLRNVRRSRLLGGTDEVTDLSSEAAAWKAVVWA